MHQAVPYEALKPPTARIAPKTPVFCSYEFKDRTRDETTAIRIREAAHSFIGAGTATYSASAACVACPYFDASEDRVMSYRSFGSRMSDAARCVNFRPRRPHLSRHHTPTLKYAQQGI